MVSPNLLRIVSSRPLSPSTVCSCPGPDGVDCVAVGADVLGADELVPGADGLVLGADGSRCAGGSALVVGRSASLPSGQTMTTTTTMTTTITRAARIQTAGLCHHGGGACACWAFGIAGGVHAGRSG